MRKSFGAKTIAYPAPVFIVGSYDENGKANAMNAVWGGICSSNPPCISVSLRAQRKTYDNIMDKKAFTINLPSEEYIAEADYFGMVSGRDIDKFEKTGLTPVKSELVDAPYIDEFPVAIECRLHKVVEIGVHIQLIGEIVDVKIRQECLDENGQPDIDKINPVLFTPEIRHYLKFGAKVADAFSAGKKFIE